MSIYRHRMTLRLAVVVIPLSLAVPAVAGDATHATCDGSLSIDAGDGKPQTKKVAATFDDARADADKRKTTMRATVDGKTYAGTTVSSADAIPIQLKAGAAILFDGTVTYVGDQITFDGHYLLDKRKPKLTGALTCKER
jgi:hypothetical protein